MRFGLAPRGEAALVWPQPCSIRNGCLVWQLSTRRCVRGAQGGDALMRLTYALLWMFGPRSFVAGLIADKTVAPNAGPDRGAIVAAAVAALNRCDRRGLLVAAHSVMFNRPDFLPLLPKVSVPTLLMTGAEDSLFPPAEARTLADAIPNCRFVVLERSAHQSPLEVPGDVSAAIRDRYK